MDYKYIVHEYKNNKRNIIGIFDNNHEAEYYIRDLTKALSEDKENSIKVMQNTEYYDKLPRDKKTYLRYVLELNICYEIEAVDLSIQIHKLNLLSGKIKDSIGTVDIINNDVK